MLLDPCRSGDINVSIAVGAVTSCDIRGAQGCRRGKFCCVKLGEILNFISLARNLIPIRQCPRGWTAKTDHIRPDLRFQSQQISAMPGKKVRFGADTDPDIDWRHLTAVAVRLARRRSRQSTGQTR